ncbi:hypothetical protein EV127DRAFT_113426 [Xylaria flabelliformis]|nr:hypothetical protein EV127DRAFT_113426 [Xylaria flabelliformis]
MPPIKSSVRFRAFPQTPKLATQDSAGKGQVEQHDVRISSFVQPSIEAGTYEINVVQNIRTPDSSTDEAPLTSKKIFTVQAPKFKLNLADDIHSVYPAPGHSDYGNTLAHVVFSDPTTPWERPMKDIEDVDKFNKTPWVAVLTFTEGELKMPQADIDRSIKSPQGNTFTTTTTAGNIAGLKADGIITPLDASNFTSDFKDTDPVDLLPLPVKLFKSLFVRYSNGKADTWTGKPDTSRYASVAHIRDVHGGDMASTTQGEPERSHAVVISHRTAQIGLTTPINVISHLVSLEGVDGMDVPDGCPYQYVGLVSLYSWNWMAVPPDHADFIHTMDKLSKNLQPLRMNDEFIAKIVADGETPTEAEARFLQRIKDGYLLKQRTLTTGEKTMSFFRGPLCPNMISDSLIKPWSLYGTDLQILDRNTGIVDISYAVAWNLGFSQAVGDPAFSTCLLRLRGKIHSQALLRAKEKVDQSYKSLPEYLQQLKAAVDHLASTGNPDETASAEALRRWHITSPMNSEGEGAQRLSLDFSPVLQQYLDQIDEITKTLTSDRADSKPAGDGSLYNELDPVDHDWAYVLGWLLDRLFAAKLPLHYLIPDPESLPRESIRTFFIDPTWLECVVDGALSIANHFEKNDDSIRRQLKEAINTYLSSSSAPGQLPQMPKWGFLMRSIAVSSFPDLKVDAPFPAGKESLQSKMLLMQRLSEDVILCLFDRCPDDDNFGSIVFSQPAHQQSFACGDFLDAENLKMAFRFIPNVPGATIASLAVKSKTIEWKRGDTSVSPVYDWDSRCIIVPSFAKWCIETLEQPGFFDWDQERRGIPSSLICSQLSKAVFKLTLTSPTTNTTTAKSGPRQLFVPPRRSVPKQMPSETNAKAQPVVIPKVALPVGNRPQPQRPEVEAKATGTELQPADVPRYIYPPLERFETGFDGTETTQFIYTPRIYPLQNPKDKEKATIPDNFGRPQDLLFEIQTRTERSGVPWNPRQFEWLIPVRLPSLGTPIDPAVASLPVMLEIGGSISHPDLPKVEPVNRGCRWLYDTRLLYGSLLKGDDSGWRRKYVIEDETTHLQALLVIRARSRENHKLWPDRNLKKVVDATFLLKRVRVAKVSDAEKAAGRDVPYSIVSLPAVKSATQPVMAQSFSIKISSS